MNPYQVVKDFEAALCDYTDAPYAVTVNSCTNAIFLALKYQYDRIIEKALPDNHKRITLNIKDLTVEIPKHTYVSVPMQIKHAGFDLKFRNEEWEGAYNLTPFNIWDSARWFTKDMFNQFSTHYCDTHEKYICVSFHWSKTLGIQQGGAILHNDPEFDKWARMARFDGRTEGIAPKSDDFRMLGWHMYMSPEIAAEGLVRLKFLKDDNDPLPNDDYPDLSQMEIFK